MYKSMRRIFCLVSLTILLVFSLTSCSGRSSDSSSKSKPEKKEPATEDMKSFSEADADFEEFTAMIFRTELVSNTLNLHYTLADPSAYGIESYEISLGDYSKSSELSSYSTLENYKAALETIPYDQLNANNQLTYEILVYCFDLQLEGGRYNLFDEPLSPTIGTQAQLPVLLAEYTFYTKSDIINYITLLNQMPALYESILSFEQRKANAGLFMADFAVDDIISQCTQYIEDPESNYLIGIFDEKIDAYSGLTEDETAEFKQQNKTAVLESVVPAYELLIEGLTALKGSGTNEKGLSNYKEGKSYYDYLVKKNTGSSHTVDELKLLIDAQMTNDMLVMNQALIEDPSLLTDINLDDFTMTDPDEMLVYLERAVKDAFPEPPAVNYEVKYVHESLEEHLSPAFYLVPPLDDMENNVIYINRANGHESIDLFTTLAHEGYPGHLYQTVYSTSTSSDDIRALFSFSGYVEGWATYVEMYSYSIAGLDDNTAMLLQANNSFILALYANIDIGIHYDGWDMAETAAYLHEYGITDAETAEQIFRYIVEEPANYLKYYIGYLEFTNLRYDAQEHYGEDFVLKDFHEQILSIGPAPFDLLRSYILEGQ